HTGCANLFATGRQRRIEIENVAARIDIQIATAKHRNALRIRRGAKLFPAFAIGEIAREDAPRGGFECRNLPGCIQRKVIAAETQDPVGEKVLLLRAVYSLREPHITASADRDITTLLGIHQPHIASVQRQNPRFDGAGIGQPTTEIDRRVRWIAEWAITLLAI